MTTLDLGSNFEEVENSFIEEDENREPVVRWITFQLSDETYGIEVQQVREILRINNILPVPGSPDYVLGITNIRGNVVTVIDARHRMNLPIVENTELSRMIVLESNDEVVAVVVDNVSNIIDLPESSIDSNPKLNTSNDARFIDGVVSHGDDLIIILNVERFIIDEQYAMAS